MTHLIFQNDLISQYRNIHEAYKYLSVLSLTLALHEVEINVSAIYEILLKSLTFFYLSWRIYFPEEITR